MRTHGKLLLGALAAALVLAAAVSTASARRIELSSQSFTIAWTELRFAGQTAIAAPEARCPVTLEGTLHSRTISKVSGQLIGYLTRAALSTSRCTFNGAQTLEFLNGVIFTNSLPWHLRYDSFEGTLPAITGIRLQLIGVSVLIQLATGSCLYRSTAGNPAFATAVVESGPITNLRWDATRPIPKETGGAACPASEFLENAGGRSSYKVLGAEASVTVRLVQ